MNLINLFPPPWLFGGEFDRQNCDWASSWPPNGSNGRMGRQIWQDLNPGTRN